MNNNTKHINKRKINMQNKKLNKNNENSNKIYFFFLILRLVLPS